MMKKYIIFVVSFLLLFTILQYLAGMLFTLMYSPDIDEAWKMAGVLSEETVIKGNTIPFLLTLCSALLAASIAYFIPKKFNGNSSNY